MRYSKYTKQIDMKYIIPILFLIAFGGFACWQQWQINQLENTLSLFVTAQDDLWTHHELVDMKFIEKIKDLYSNDTILRNGIIELKKK